MLQPAPSALSQSGSKRTRLGTQARGRLPSCLSSQPLKQSPLLNCSAGLRAMISTCLRVHKGLLSMGRGGIEHIFFP